MVTPSRATLYRFAATANLERDPHLETDPPARAFAHQDFGQLWTADFLHGPKKIRVNGQKRKTYLYAIIDDATRYVVHACFFLAEDTEVMMRELMAAVKTHGKPIRFYTDNGACYASHHLKFVCATLGIHLIHTPPGNPRGRGKVERSFRRVRDQFLDGETPVAHTKSVHTSLGVSPLQ
jgi:transposase InsO family protein